MTPILLALALATAAPSERFAEACAEAQAGDPAAAIGALEAIAAEGLDGPSLRLALGDARLRLGQRGRAIAEWERARRLDPSDADAGDRLRDARASDPDRALAGEATFVDRLVERTGDVAAVAFFLAPWWLLWGALAVRRRTAGAVRRALAAAALVLALASAAGGTLLAAMALDRRLPAAIVVAPASGVRERPAPELEPTVDLHEGTRVRVVGAQGGYLRVRLDGGLAGWIRREDVELL